MKAQKDCEHARTVSWSDVVYRCDNIERCYFELKLPGDKYCNSERREKIIGIRRILYARIDELMLSK